MTILNAENKIKLSTISKVRYISGVAGMVGGAVYANKTGGGVWRTIGFAIGVGLATSFVTNMVSRPIIKKIINK